MPMDFEIEAEHDAGEETPPGLPLAEEACGACGAVRIVVPLARIGMACCWNCYPTVIRYPDRERDVYPVLAGPGAWLPLAPVPAPEVSKAEARGVKWDGIFPAPVLTSRDEASKELPIPSAVRKLAERAVAASWDVRVQTSMGCVPNAAHGAPGAVKTLHAVVGRRGQRAFNAVHDGLKWKIMVWSDTIPWFPSCSVTDLDQWIKGYDHDQWPAWIEAVRQRVRAAEAAKKARVQAAPARPKTMEGL
jgi:hypothetical protein